MTKKREDNPVTRGVRINTPPIQVEIQSSSSGDSLDNIIEKALDIIDKYGEEKSKC